MKGWLAIACSQLAGNAVSHAVPGGAAAGGLLQRRMLIRTGLDPTTVTTALTATGLLQLTTLFALPVLAVPALLAGEILAPPLLLGALIGVALFVVLTAAGTVFFTVDRVVAPIARFIGRVLCRVRPRRALRPEAFADRLFHSRAFVRDAVTGSWKRAFPSAAGNQLLDFAALQASLVAVGAHPHPSITLLAYVAAAALGMIPFDAGRLRIRRGGLDRLAHLERRRGRRRRRSRRCSTASSRSGCRCRSVHSRRSCSTGAPLPAEA